MGQWCFWYGKESDIHLCWGLYIDFQFPFICTAQPETLFVPNSDLKLKPSTWNLMMGSKNFATAKTARSCSAIEIPGFGPHICREINICTHCCKQTGAGTSSQSKIWWRLFHHLVSWPPLKTIPSMLWSLCSTDCYGQRHIRFLLVGRHVWGHGHFIHILFVGVFSQQNSTL